MHALVTGGAGFIGSHLVDRLLTDGCRVTVVDNFDPFYDASAKRANIVSHRDDPNYRLVEVDVRDLGRLMSSLSEKYDLIVHMAARAGVRASIADPITCQEINVSGTQNMLEFAKERGIAQFVFASSSSVYGVNPRVPWCEDDCVLLPISPYACTKVSGELLGHTYSHLYGIRFIGLRLFTVHGPRQRPDLAIHKFARLMLRGEAIPVYGDGTSSRDYTYVGDIVNGIRAAMEYEGTDYEVVNLGSDNVVSLNELISALEDILGTKACIDPKPEQPGDVPRTWADLSKAKRLLGYAPTTDLKTGMAELVEWIRRDRD